MKPFFNAHQKALIKVLYFTKFWQWFERNRYDYIVITPDVKIKIKLKK